VNLPLGDDEIDAVEGDDLPEAFADPVGPDDRSRPALRARADR
jgi:hypothetical protein